MAKFTRTLIIGAMLAAMHLVGMTAVAHAQATDQQAALRPPSEGQVGEAWRPSPSPFTTTGRRGRRPQADAGPRALLRPQRDARPGASPGARRAERAGPLADRFAGCAGGSAGAGRAGRQADEAQGSAPPRHLSTSDTLRSCHEHAV